MELNPRRGRAATVSHVRHEEVAEGGVAEEQEESGQRVGRAYTVRSSMGMGRMSSNGHSVMLNRKVLAELFNTMRDMADADPASLPPHSRLLPFSHLRVRTMGGLHKLRTPAAERFRRPPWYKYLAVVVQMAVLLLNVTMLVRSLRIGINFCVGLASSDEVFEGYIQVGYLTAADRQNLVSLFEGVGLLWYLGRLVASWGQAQGRAEDGIAGLRRWAAHACIYWELLPALRTFSALRMLRRVHPQLLPMELGALIKMLQRERAPNRRKLLVLINFFGQRLLILYCGFQAFIFKFTSTARRLQATAGSPYLQLLVSFAFLNQLLGGVIQLEKLMRNRLVLFLFGGEDAHIDGEEAALMHVWLACLARSLQLEALQSKGPWPRMRAVVIMSCFNHMDLQQIVLIEDAKQVTERHILLRKFSKGASGMAGEELDLEEPSLQDLLDGGGDPALPNAHNLLRGD